MDIEKLIIEYGNAMFDCGEYDNDDPKEWIKEFNDLKKVAEEARQKLFEAYQGSDRKSLVDQSPPGG